MSIEIRGNKIILTKKADNKRIAFPIETITVEESDYVWICHKSSDDSEVRVMEYFDDILEAIEKHNSKKVYNNYTCTVDRLFH